MRKQKELLTALPRHIGLAMISSLLLQAGLGLPTGSGPDYWRNESLYRSGDIERHPGPKRSLPWRGRNVLIHSAQHYDVAVAECETFLRVKEIHGPEKLVSHDVNDIRNAGLCALRLSVTSWPPLAAQCSFSNVYCIPLPASGTACGWYGG